MIRGKMGRNRVGGVIGGMIKIILMAYMITCILEFFAALGMKITAKKGYLLICFVNLLTNPLANLLYYEIAPGLGRVEGYRHLGVIEEFTQWTGYDPVWVLIEVFVVVCEGGIYCRFREWIPSPWKYAVMANVVSAMAGLFVPWLW